MTRKAIVGFSRPAEISRSPTTSGVTEFCSYGVLIGTSHSSWPSAAATPTSLFCDCVIDLPGAGEGGENRRRIAGTVTGPSPLHGAGGHVHRGQRAGAVCRQGTRSRCCRRPSASVAVPNSGGVGGAFLRHSNLPVARSCAEKMPLMPSVNTRPSAIAGVDFGPGPWPVRRRVHRVRRIDAVLPELLARLRDRRPRRFRDCPGACGRSRGCRRPPAMRGRAPTVACHRLVSCAGHAAGTVNVEATPSRAGPRHCDHRPRAAAPG